MIGKVKLFRSGGYDPGPKAAEPQTGFVVAINQKEADEIARDRPELIHDTRASVDEHLREVKAPPTDPYYANQYHVYTVGKKRKAAKP